MPRATPENPVGAKKLLRETLSGLSIFEMEDAIAVGGVALGDESNPSILKPPLLVALRPMVMPRVPIHVAGVGGRREGGVVEPGGIGTGAPPCLSNTGAVSPSQVACRLPLDICHSPLTRWPP